LVKKDKKNGRPKNGSVQKKGPGHSSQRGDHQNKFLGREKGGLSLEDGGDKCGRRACRKPTNPKRQPNQNRKRPKGKKMVGPRAA